MYSMVNIVINTVLHIYKLLQVNLKSSHHKKKEKNLWLCMVIDGNQTYCDVHFAIHTNVKSLNCTPETNIVFYVNYTSIEKFLGQDQMLILILN